jgi:alkylhydroperoxidase family enzyme
MNRTQPPLSSNEQAALDYLEQSAAETPLAHERAVEQLIDAGFVAPAAHDLIDQLYLKGYLDEGNDEIRLIHDD